MPETPFDPLAAQPGMELDARVDARDVHLDEIATNHLSPMAHVGEVNRFAQAGSHTRMAPLFRIGNLVCGVLLAVALLSTAF